MGAVGRGCRWTTGESGKDFSQCSPVFKLRMFFSCGRGLGKFMSSRACRGRAGQHGRLGPTRGGVEADCNSAAMPFISWDTEGGGRAEHNLLRAGISPNCRKQGKVVRLTGKGERRGADQVRFRLAAAEMHIDWSVRTARGGLPCSSAAGAELPADGLN